jgi:hypothetical protein
MRLIEHKIPDKYLKVIESTKQKEFKPIIGFTMQDVYEDVSSIALTGLRSVQRNLKSYTQINKEFMASEGKMDFRVLREIFDARTAIVKFAHGDFMRNLIKDRKIKKTDKVQIVVKAIEELFVVHEDKKEEERRKQGAEQQGAEQQGRDSNKEDSKKSNASPSGENSLSEFYQQASGTLDILAPPEFGSSDEKDDGDKPSDRSAPGNDSSAMAMKKIDRDIAQKIVRLIDNVERGDGRIIFDLAKNFSLSLDKKDYGEYKDVKIGNSVRFKKMRSLSEVKHLRTSDWGLPDEMFDLKLMKKDFIIKQPTQRYKKNQLLYILADTSDSMSGCGRSMRELFMKATLLALGRNSVKTSGLFYFRWFNSTVSPLMGIESERDWLPFVDEVFNKRMAGNTDILYAVNVAKRDIQDIPHIVDETEIVLITDGTESLGRAINFQGDNMKAHVVLLEKVREDVMANYKKVFNTVIESQVTTVDEALNNGLKLINVV